MYLNVDVQVDQKDVRSRDWALRTSFWDTTMMFFSPPYSTAGIRSCLV